MQPSKLVLEVANKTLLVIFNSVVYMLEHSHVARQILNHSNDWSNNNNFGTEKCVSITNNTSTFTDITFRLDKAIFKF